MECNMFHSSSLYQEVNNTYTPTYGNIPVANLITLAGRSEDIQLVSARMMVAIQTSYQDVL